ncbi:basic helix-loop-helix DNA-binding superfamily protein [Perilla frutescens var. hirtella]|uniref:Basic helix-loop-helix DNA-binding superfamily protein n=1 Tax=Perilla frutescens var. hirtella TaxID=608512 RepID=A0AAD4IZB5_PERFH|nr:basic helix-loop-helix DNA-binding superfamily protein [Perilla frutescens var. hirtella]
MFQENGGFDESSSSLHGGGGGITQAEDAFSQTHLPNSSNFSMEVQSYPQNDVAALAMELQHNLQIGADIQEMSAFNAERNMRLLLNDKYRALRTLVPSPTGNDRASIVDDAINYINELKRTVTLLKVLVEKKRCARERLEKPKQEENATVEGIESKCVGDMDPYNGSSHLCSWLHRKSKNTEVDVRIIDDEVTVKLVQQKRINCLLFVSKVLDELQLDLHHVAGGVIGDYYSYLFNSKICEGSTVYASAVANKVIEVVDKQCVAFPPTTTY